MRKLLLAALFGLFASSAVGGGGSVGSLGIDRPLFNR
jgi:hypothetical protein